MVEVMWEVKPAKIKVGVEVEVMIDGGSQPIEAANEAVRPGAVREGFLECVGIEPAFTDSWNLAGENTAGHPKPGECQGEFSGTEEVGCVCGAERRAPWRRGGGRLGWHGEWSTTRRVNPEECRFWVVNGESWKPGPLGKVCCGWSGNGEPSAGRCAVRLRDAEPLGAQG